MYPPLCEEVQIHCNKQVEPGSKTGPTKRSASLSLPAPASSSSSSTSEQGCPVLCRGSKSPKTAIDRAQGPLYPGRKPMNGMAYFSFLFSIFFSFLFPNREWVMQVPSGHTHTKVLPRLKPLRDSSNLHDENCVAESTSQMCLILSLLTATTLVQDTFISPWTPPVASYLASLPPLCTPCNSLSDLFKTSMGWCHLTARDLLMPSHSTENKSMA